MKTYIHARTDREGRSRFDPILVLSCGDLTTYEVKVGPEDGFSHPEVADCILKVFRGEVLPERDAVVPLDEILGPWAYDARDTARILVDRLGEPYFDRFDVVAAYYRYCLEYHGGQATSEYAVLSVPTKLQYRSRRELLTDNAFIIYLRLVLGYHTNGDEGRMVRQTRG